MRAADPIRDKLWADVYATHVARKTIWFEAQKEANLAVEAYDRRPEPEDRAAIAASKAAEGGKP